MVYWNKNNLNIQIKINSNSVEGHSRSPFMIFNPRRELTNSCIGNIAGFSSFILRFGLEEKSNTSSWTSQAVPGCTWVGLDWGRDYGLVFLDPWDHKLHPTRVPLCLAPHWWFHSKIACRLGKAAVKQWNHRTQTAAVSLALHTQVAASSPMVEVLRGEQTALASSGDAGLAGPTGLR